MRTCSARMSSEGLSGIVNSCCGPPMLIRSADRDSQRQWLRFYKELRNSLCGTHRDENDDFFTGPAHFEWWRRFGVAEFRWAGKTKEVVLGW